MGIMVRVRCSTTAITSSKWPRPPAWNTALHDRVLEDQTRPDVVLPLVLEEGPPSKQYRSTARNKPRPSKDDLRCFASSSDNASGFNGTRVMTPTNEVLIV